MIVILTFDVLLLNELLVLLFRPIMEFERFFPLELSNSELSFKSLIIAVKSASCDFVDCPLVIKVVVGIGTLLDFFSLIISASNSSLCIFHFELSSLNKFP